MAGSIGWHVWLGVSLTIVPATFAVGARFIARRCAGLGLLADDWTILAALVVAWAMAADRFYALVNDGYGYHAYEPQANVMDYQKAFLAVQMTYFLAAVLTKTSILLLYNRIFGVYGRFKLALCFVESLVVSYFIICVSLAVAGCQPVSYFWNKHQPGRCMNEVQFFRWNGVTNLILDVLVLALPLPMVWTLQLRYKQKLALSCIFAVGTFACLASILRIAQFQKSKQSDPTYTTIDSGMWSSIEQNVGIICACLPTLRPLVRSYWGKSGHSVSIPPMRPYHRQFGSLEPSHEMSAWGSRQQSQRTEVSKTAPLWQKDVESESAVAITLDSLSRHGHASVSHGSEISSDQMDRWEQELVLPPCVIHKQTEVHQEVVLGKIREDIEVL
ncbi:hypothetical protein Tdes44962_MAKER04146 [Teratosphaeria destructans]|uniref:Rhodopsin domain-containing protein n=1 Tax=Teratosphaeria destructans TaxID=418781 RepID=A0A9W7W0N2_9PEZI|nr:hypothetical protein Tdes44962_MAKER04146 [Teratosphaeria destructans]